ncbi:MAG: hypothetical protein K0B02_04015 [DPANN group archaeon]|nr:hypothetical protein [DPANN group archaeon]
MKSKILLIITILLALFAIYGINTTYAVDYNVQGSLKDIIDGFSYPTAGTIDILECNSSGVFGVISTTTISPNGIFSENITTADGYALKIAAVGYVNQTVLNGSNCYYTNNPISLEVIPNTHSSFNITVKDFANSMPIKDAQVKVYKVGIDETINNYGNYRCIDNICKTDSDGNILMFGSVTATNTSYYVTINHTSYDTYKSSTYSYNIPYTSRQDEILNIAIKGTAKIYGTLRDTYNTTIKVQNANVTIVDSNGNPFGYDNKYFYTILTDVNGYYELYVPKTLLNNTNGYRIKITHNKYNTKIVGESSTNNLVYGDFEEISTTLEGPTTVYAKITDYWNTQPIYNATITVVEDFDQNIKYTTFTNNTGEFSFKIRDNTGYALSILSDGYTATAPLALTGNYSGDIRLNGTATLSGKVIDINLNYADEYNPAEIPANLVNITAYVTTPSGYFTYALITNNTGEYNTRMKGNSEYYLTAEKNGYNTITTIETTTQVSNIVDITIKGNSWINGTVLDQNTGKVKQELVNAFVYVDDINSTKLYKTTTNTNGEFGINVPGTLNYNVYYIADGFYLFNNTEQQIASPTNPRDFVIQMTGNIRLSGIVTDSEIYNNNIVKIPYANMTIQYNSNDTTIYRLQSDSNGNFDYQIGLSGNYKILVDKSGYLAWNSSLLGIGYPANQSIVINPRLDGSITITGSVKTLFDEPVQNADIIIYDTIKGFSYYKSTDIYGNFSAKIPSTLTYKITTHSSQYTDITKCEQGCTGYGTSPYNFVIEPVFEIEVKDSQNYDMAISPIENAKVSLYHYFNNLTFIKSLTSTELEVYVTCDNLSNTTNATVYIERNPNIIGIKNNDTNTTFNNLTMFSEVPTGYFDINVNASSLGCGNTAGNINITTAGITYNQTFNINKTVLILTASDPRGIIINNTQIIGLTGPYLLNYTVNNTHTFEYVPSGINTLTALDIPSNYYTNTTDILITEAQAGTIINMTSTPIILPPHAGNLILNITDETGFPVIDDVEIKTKGKAILEIGTVLNIKDNLSNIHNITMVSFTINDVTINYDGTPNTYDFSTLPLIISGTDYIIIEDVFINQSNPTDAETLIDIGSDFYIKNTTINGLVSFSNLQSYQNITVNGTAKGYNITEAYIYVLPDQSKHVDLTLKNNELVLFIEGSSVQGANVTLWSGPVGSTIAQNSTGSNLQVIGITDVGGDGENVTFRGLLWGTYNISISLDGHNNYTGEITLDQSTNFSDGFRYVELDLQQTFTRIIVRDSSTQSDLNNINVSMVKENNPAENYTNITSGGEVLLGDGTLLSGTYNITINGTKEGYSLTQYQVNLTLGSQNIQTVYIDENLFEILVTSDGINPLQGANVSIWTDSSMTSIINNAQGIALTALTDINGIVTFNKLLSEAWALLSINMSGYTQWNDTTIVIDYGNNTYPTPVNLGGTTIINVYIYDEINKIITATTEGTIINLLNSTDDIVMSTTDSDKDGYVQFVSTTLIPGNHKISADGRHNGYNLNETELFSITIGTVTTKNATLTENYLVINVTNGTAQVDDNVIVSLLENDILPYTSDITNQTTNSTATLRRVVVGDPGEVYNLVIDGTQIGYNSTIIQNYQTQLTWGRNNQTIVIEENKLHLNITSNGSNIEFDMYGNGTTITFNGMALESDPFNATFKKIPYNNYTLNIDGTMQGYENYTHPQLIEINKTTTSYTININMTVLEVNVTNATYYPIGDANVTVYMSDNVTAAVDAMNNTLSGLTFADGTRVFERVLPCMDCNISVIVSNKTDGQNSTRFSIFAGDNLSIWIDPPLNDDPLNTNNPSLMGLDESVMFYDYHKGINRSNIYKSIIGDNWNITIQATAGGSGIPLANVSIYKGDSNFLDEYLIASNLTNSGGNITFTLPDGFYDIRIDGQFAGYGIDLIEKLPVGKLVFSEANTNEFGEIQIKADSKYYVRVDAKGYSQYDSLDTYGVEGGLYNGTYTNLTELNGKEKINLTGLATVEGFITDKYCTHNDCQFVEDAVVSFGQYSSGELQNVRYTTKTDSNGYYSIAASPYIPGATLYNDLKQNYDILIEADGRYLKDVLKNNVLYNSSTSEYNFSLIGQGTVSGTIYNKQLFDEKNIQTPIVNVGIKFKKGISKYYESITDIVGHFIISINPLFSPWDLTLYVTNFETTITDLFNGTETDMELYMYQGGAAINRFNVQSDTNLTLANISITFNPYYSCIDETTSCILTTNENGTVQRHMEASTQNAKVDGGYLGYSVANIMYTSITNQENEINVTLNTTKVNLIFKDESLGSVENLGIAMSLYNCTNVQNQKGLCYFNNITNDNGSVMFSLVPTGTYSISFASNIFAYDGNNTFNLTVTDQMSGKNNEITYLLNNTEILIKFVNDTGSTVENISLSLSGPTGLVYSGTSGTGITVSNIPYGQYTVVPNAMQILSLGFVNKSYLLEAIFGEDEINGNNQTMTLNDTRIKFNITNETGAFEDVNVTIYKNTDIALNGFNKTLTGLTDNNGILTFNNVITDKYWNLNSITPNYKYVIDADNLGFGYYESNINIQENIPENGLNIINKLNITPVTVYMNLYDVKDMYNISRETIKDDTIFIYVWNDTGLTVDAQGQTLIKSTAIGELDFKYLYKNNYSAIGTSVNGTYNIFQNKHIFETKTTNFVTTDVYMNRSKYAYLNITVKNQQGTLLNNAKLTLMYNTVILNVSTNMTTNITTSTNIAGLGMIGVNTTKYTEALLIQAEYTISDKTYITQSSIFNISESELKQITVTIIQDIPATTQTTGCVGCGSSSSSGFSIPLPYAGSKDSKGTEADFMSYTFKKTPDQIRKTLLYEVRTMIKSLTGQIVTEDDMNTISEITNEVYNDISAKRYQTLENGKYIVTLEINYTGKKIIDQLIISEQLPDSLKLDKVTVLANNGKITVNTLLNSINIMFENVSSDEDIITIRYKINDYTFKSNGFLEFSKPLIFATGFYIPPIIISDSVCGNGICDIDEDCSCGDCAASPLCLVDTTEDGFIWAKYLAILALLGVSTIIIYKYLKNRKLMNYESKYDSIVNEKPELSPILPPPSPPFMSESVNEIRSFERTIENNIESIPRLVAEQTRTFENTVSNDLNNINKQVMSDINQIRDVVSEDTEQIIPRRLDQI